ncbi:hypothetical protein [Allorhodopirellula heiligendammensis]|uniref:4Fe-4S ferredoxin-type domain-containing protein n=1 Tax=Allorhodopirellula heiligendammensis TaxID=2714739 RepID=A0A5C6BX92_9BACT|nr:hypothetical protein [Allorhodopirellula heiligendammensis]TWU16575.1 hypothetical protein Poly21_37800 [Allorhodopirellula heiligendammensis]
MFIHTKLHTGLMVAGLMCLLAPGSALAGHGKVLDQTGCICCPVCDHVCKLDAKKVEEEREGFQVESKAICIPRVVFPWQKERRAACASCDSCGGQGCISCVHNGARIRKVCVLKTEKYKCPACKYSWSAEEKKQGDCGCHGGLNCNCQGPCDAGQGITVSPSVPQPMLQDETIRTADAQPGLTDYYLPSKQYSQR